MTGGQVISEELGFDLKDTQISQLGTAKQVKIQKELTIIVDGAGDKNAIADRVAQIRRELEASTSEFDKEKLQERLAKLSGGVAVIKVGAATETEMKDKKLRIEDALNATRAGVEEGIVSGGGTILVEIAKDMDSFKLEGEEGIGVEIVKKALTAPLRQIAENAGVDGAVVLEKVKDMPEGYGFNAASEKYVNMIEEGILDPVKVTRSAIQNAASVSALILTTEVLVASKKEPKQPEMNPGMMPGMM